jgi:hypothetical protein
MPPDEVTVISEVAYITKIARAHNVGIERNRMQVATTKGILSGRPRFFAKPGETTSLHFSGALCQRVLSELTAGIYKKETITSLANKLIAIADLALDLHHEEIVEQASEILVNAPLPREYQSAGKYFQALCIKRRGDYTSAHAMLEQVAESSIAPQRFRGRALLGLASFYCDANQIAEASRLYFQAAHASSPRYGGDLQTSIFAQLMLATVKGIHGDNKGALADLEKLFPFVRFLMRENPVVYYIYNNNIAVELTEAGRLEEAQRASNIAIASPYAAVHPEWHETRLELRAKARNASRSIVSVRNASAGSNNNTDSNDNADLNNDTDPNNIVHLLVPQHNLAQGAENHPAQVYSFQQWKSKMIKGTNEKPDEKPTGKELRKMTKAQKRVRIMKLIYNENVSDEELAEILRFAEDLSLNVKQ